MSKNRGILYIVALPIGNLKDITLRALEVLKEVDIILTEDTRAFKKIEKVYGLPSKRLESFYKDVEASKEDQVIAWLREGQKLALCSEAGTPLLSDPGARLVKRAYEEGIRVVPIPGPSALTAALSASGLELSKGFIFLGFLPKKRGEIKKSLLSLPKDYPLIVFIPPHRFKETINILVEFLGDRKAFLAREITKYHEELRWTTLQELSNLENIKGEITLIIKEAENGDSPKKIELKEIKRAYEELKAYYKGKKEIAKNLAQKFGISVKEIYQIIKDFKK